MSTKPPSPTQPDRAQVRVTFTALAPAGVSAKEYLEFFSKLMGFFYPTHRVVVNGVEQEVETPAETYSETEALPETVIPVSTVPPDEDLL